MTDTNRRIIVTITDDIKAVARLLQEWTEREYDDKLILHNSRLIVARDEERIVGYCQLITIDDPFWRRRWGLVENVYVALEYRGRGVAREMMRFTETEALGMGCAFIKLTSAADKVAAHALYRSAGYVEGKSFKKEVGGEI